MYGSYPLSPEEGQALQAKQREHSRRQRLLQVRQQEKEQAAERARRYKASLQSEACVVRHGCSELLSGWQANDTAAMLPQAQEELKDAWQTSLQQEIGQVSAQQQAALDALAASHRSAAAARERQKHQLLHKQTREQQLELHAQQRFRKALHQQHAAKQAAVHDRVNRLQRQHATRKENDEHTLLLVTQYRAGQRQEQLQQAALNAGEAARLQQGLPSAVDYRFSRMHELGVAAPVERHVGAGADGLGRDPLRAALDAADRSDGLCHVPGVLQAKCRPPAQDGPSCPIVERNMLVSHWADNVKHLYDMGHAHFALRLLQSGSNRWPPCSWMGQPQQQGRDHKHSCGFGGC